MFSFTLSDSIRSYHDLCRSWLNAVVNGDSRYGISPQVLSGVMRVTTHPRVFSQPSALSEVIGSCEALMAQSHCVLFNLDHSTGLFSRGCAKKLMRAATWYLTRGTQRWP
jgi:predicted nucleic acid-binding protein